MSANQKNGGSVNDPTNWNIDPSIKSIEVADHAMAKEMERRWNAYPGLVAALEKVNQYFIACAQSWEGATGVNDAPVAHGEHLDVMANEAGDAVLLALATIAK